MATAQWIMKPTDHDFVNFAKEGQVARVRLALQVFPYLVDVKDKVRLTMEGLLTMRINFVT